MSIKVCNGKEYFDLSYGEPWFRPGGKLFWWTTNGILLNAVEAGFAILKKDVRTYGTLHTFTTNDGQIISEYYHDHSTGFDTWNPFINESRINKLNKTGEHVFTIEDIEEECRQECLSRRASKSVTTISNNY